MIRPESFNIHVFGPSHFWMKDWADRLKYPDRYTNNWFDCWFFSPEIHSTGGTGFVVRWPGKIGLHVSIHWI